MLAGIIFGPNTPGIALVDDPHDLELLAALGLILLLFHLGLEFSHRRPARRRPVAARDRRRSTSRSTSAAGSAFGFALGWGTREALVIAGAIGISSSAIVTKLLIGAAPARQPREPADPRDHRRRGRVPRAVPRGAATGARRRPTARSTRSASSPTALGVPARADRDRARWGAQFVGRLDRDAATTSCSRSASSGLAVLVAGRRARGRRLRRDRRVHDRPGPGRDDGRAPDRTARAAAARRVRGGVLLRVRAHDRPQRRG